MHTGLHEGNCCSGSRLLLYGWLAYMLHAKGHTSIAGSFQGADILRFLQICLDPQKFNPTKCYPHVWVWGHLQKCNPTKIRFHRIHENKKITLYKERACNGCIR